MKNENHVLMFLTCKEKKCSIAFTVSDRYRVLKVASPEKKFFIVQHVKQFRLCTDHREYNLLIIHLESAL